MGSTKSNNKPTAYFPDKERAIEFIKDYQNFHIKWGTEAIAGIFGMTRQNINYHKKKEEKTK